MTQNAVRLRLITLIHVARRDLEKGGKMDEPTYRTMLRTAGGADSTAKMDVPSLERVLEQAKKAGFVVRSKSGDRRQDTSPEARKVRALWLFLHELGVVKSPTEAALATYVKRIAYVDDMHWADARAMARLIETMKKWAMRFLPQAVKAQQAEVARARRAGLLSPAQVAVVDELQQHLERAHGFDLYQESWEVYSRLLGREMPAPVHVAHGGKR